MPYPLSQKLRRLLPSLAMVLLRPGVGGECGLCVKRRNHTLPSRQRRCGDCISDDHVELTCHRMRPAQTAVHGQVTPNQRAGGSQPLQVQMETQGILQPGSHHCLLPQARLRIVVLRTGTENTWEKDGEAIAKEDRT